MITNIPLCLARAILCNWLEDMKSIVNLDSAICGKGRSTWLDILKDDIVVLRKLVILHPARVPIANLLEWISLRHVRVLEFGFPGSQLARVAVENGEALAVLAAAARSLQLTNCHEVTVEKYGFLGSLFTRVEKLSLRLCTGSVGIQTFFHERLQSLEVHLHTIAPFVPFSAVRLRNLRHVKLRNTGHISHVDGILAAILPHSPGVTELQIVFLQGLQLQSTTVDCVVRHCHKLQYLCVTSDSLFRDEWLDAIAKACPNLIGVKANRTAAAGVQSLVTQCPQLRLLRLPDLLCDDRTLQLIAMHCGDRLLSLDVGVQSPATQGMQAIAEHCTGLRSVTLHGADTTGNSSELRAIATLLKRCKSLHTLDFGESRFDAAAFDFLAECQPAISHIAISPQSSAKGFLRLLRSCANLRELAMPFEDYSETDEVRFWRDLACDVLAVALPQVRMVKHRRLALWDERLTL
jgi:hypothetical protein